MQGAEVEQSRTCPGCGVTHSAAVIECPKCGHRPPEFSKVRYLPIEEDRIPRPWKAFRSAWLILFSPKETWPIIKEKGNLPHMIVYAVTWLLTGAITFTGVYGLFSLRDINLISALKTFGLIMLSWGVLSFAGALIVAMMSLLLWVRFSLSRVIIYAISPALMVLAGALLSAFSANSLPDVVCGPLAFVMFSLSILLALVLFLLWKLSPRLPGYLLAMSMLLISGAAFLMSPLYLKVLGMERLFDFYYYGNHSLFRDQAYLLLGTVPACVMTVALFLLIRRTGKLRSDYLGTLVGIDLTVIFSSVFVLVEKVSYGMEIGSVHVNLHAIYQVMGLGVAGAIMLSVILPPFYRWRCGLSRKLSLIVGAGVPLFILLAVCLMVAKPRFIGRYPTQPPRVIHYSSFEGIQGPLPPSNRLRFDRGGGNGSGSGK
ncbi:MAG TPA: hypothetical protein PL033_18760 [Candidatus Brocadiia bacterium]|nr:hypothetical protein [Candidatus Brocadiia bacterium]